VAKRSKCFILYEQPGEAASTTEWTSKQVGQTNLYHARVIMLPGVGDIIVVGGSEDAECTRLSDNVQLIDCSGNVKNRKPICQPRAKMGLAVGELRSEANA